MPLIIDGHNLIGQMTTIALDDPDDERHLIGVLLDYCRRTRRQATVYFDRASLGPGDLPKLANLTVRFVRRPSSADHAIERHLHSLGGTAKNWTVVTSDRRVQAAARRLGARVVAAPDFAAELARTTKAEGSGEKPDSLTPDELDRWLALFGADQPPAEGE
jgi:hypothetical protein